jgi:hypothetical protein
MGTDDDPCMSRSANISGDTTLKRSFRLGRNPFDMSLGYWTHKKGKSKIPFFGTKFSPTIIDGQWKKRCRKFCRLHIEEVIPFECLSLSPLIILPDDRYSSRSPRSAEVAGLQLRNETLVAQQRAEIAAVRSDCDPANRGGKEKCTNCGQRSTPCKPRCRRKASQPGTTIDKHQPICP